jgi:rhodanese-related sulfurtransferase
MGNSNSVSTDKAKKLIFSNYFDIILDVRESDEWNYGHHPNATHISLDRVGKKFNSKYPDKNLKILIYCRSGMRAGKAERILKAHGYKNIYVLDGPYTDLL